MSGWYVVSLFIKRNDIADVAWGLGFIVICYALLFLNGFTPHLCFITTLTTLWGIRLSIHIFLRNKNKKEDYRYKAWRKQWGKWFYIRSYVQIYLLQGAFMILISMSAIIASLNSQIVSSLNYVGILIWCVGFFFESIGDYQLAQFTKHPSNKGKIMTLGLWRYTRHPNYFGEVTQWWGICFFALTLPYGFVAIISPIVITILILGVSGIPMLEKKYEGNPTFEAYKKTTSAFFPWFPRSK